MQKILYDIPSWITPALVSPSGNTIDVSLNAFYISVACESHSSASRHRENVHLYRLRAAGWWRGTQKSACNLVTEGDTMKVVCIMIS